jgi:hypothetical protein
MGKPKQAEPLDYKAIMGQAGASAAAMMKQQFKSLVEYYPALDRLQMESIASLSTMLSEEGGILYSWKENSKKDQRKGAPQWEKIPIGKANPNTYTGKARQAVEEAIRATGPIKLQGDKLAALGDILAEQALENYEQSGPNEIESELQRQALGDLRLGRSLSPEQQRDAVQSARAAMEQRGLGTSQATTAAEILNRDALASQREAERRNFAASTNQMLLGNQMGRRDQAAQQMSLGSTLASNAGQLYGQSAGLGLEGGAALIRTDPVSRAMAPGIAMAGQTISNMGNMITPTYQSAMGLSGQVAGFNANMLDSRYNAWANMQGARMGANATQNAGMMGMVGGIGGGLLAGGGAAYGGMAMAGVAV